MTYQYAALIVGLIVLIASIACWAARTKSATDGDSDTASDYRELVQAGQGEREQFGDGTHAPYWPSRKSNGHYTLHRGVWVEDGIAPPPNSELDRLREADERNHRIIKYTLVEGEQLAPMGKDGAMIRVNASAGTPGKIYDARGNLTQIVPSVMVSPIDSKDGAWGTSFLGSLPCEMSVSVSLNSNRKGTTP